MKFDRDVKEKEPIVPMIKQEDLVHGAYYIGTCRNASIARWDANKKVFWYWRYKFGDTFTEQIKCPEDDNYYDVFIAKRMIHIQDIQETDVIPLEYASR